MRPWMPAAWRLRLPNGAGGSRVATGGRAATSLSRTALPPPPQICAGQQRGAAGGAGPQRGGRAAHRPAPPERGHFGLRGPLLHQHDAGGGGRGRAGRARVLLRLQRLRMRHGRPERVPGLAPHTDGPHRRAIHLTCMRPLPNPLATAMQVVRVVSSFRHSDFARTGSKATEDFSLDAGGCPRARVPCLRAHA